MQAERASGALALAFLALAAAAPAGVSVAEAWTPPSRLGADTPLFMTIRNGGADDALLRTRCTAATFTEPHLIDHGEGFPSMRTVRSIPIAAGGTRLHPDGPHVMLLQTTRALANGDSFKCSITFRDGGVQTVQVSVGDPAAQLTAAAPARE